MPSSTTFLFSNFIILSLVKTDDNLWEIESTVLSLEAFLSTLIIFSSVSESKLAVISSSNIIGGDVTIALAIDRSWRCPWEKRFGEAKVS